LRVGKRAHTDTGIDQAGASIVSVALERAEAVLGSLADRSVLVVGAGSMGALAGTTLRRRGVGALTVANRGLDRAERLATSLNGRAVNLDAIPDAIADVDLLVSSTGATGLVIEVDDVATRAGRPLVVLDLALPRDVDPAVADLPGVTYIGLEALRESGAAVSEDEIRAATAIVAEELNAHLLAQQQLAVAPTVTALRARANQVIESELTRLYGRLPAIDDHVRTEVSDAVRRAVEKVMHAPTVRVKELASMPGGDQYATALRELFDLDQAAVESVAAVKKNVGDRP
jgi:glutamyl-tRNA reductase